MKKKLQLILAASLLAGGIAQAELIMTIDTVNETIKYTGSDTFTPQLFSGRGYIQSQLNDFSPARGTGGIDQTTGIAMITSSASTPVVFASTDSIYQAGTATSGGLGTWMAFDNANPTTVTGTGVEVSYADWDVAGKATLAAAIGKSLPINAVFGGSDITVVPEPATAGLLGISGLILFGIRRLKKTYGIR